MRMIYLAHPLGPDGPGRKANIERARRWYKWIIDHFQVAVCCDWTIAASVWDESDQHRHVGLWMDTAIVERCDEVWLVGGRISNGMATERDHGLKFNKRIVDLTFLGEEPPTEELAPEIASLIADRRVWL